MLANYGRVHVPYTDDYTTYVKRYDNLLLVVRKWKGTLLPDTHKVLKRNPIKLEERKKTLS